MKTRYYTYIAAFLLFASCHTYQQKYNRERSRYTSLDGSLDFRYGYQMNQTDTFGRQWSFYTDSSFRYHADSGLHARSGWLWLYESGNALKELSHIVEHTAQSHTAQEDVQRDAHRTQLNIRSLIWGLIAVLLAVWFIRR